MNIYYVLLVIFLLIVLWTIGSYLVVRTIEKPTYRILEDQEGYEVREYQSYIVAETKVSGSRQEALKTGFQIIADYIFGNNVSKSSIAMTVPVLESQSSEKISMTSPVLSTENSTSERTIAFVLPSKYSLETLPIPNNTAVIIREVPAHKVAVLKFTWYATPARIENKKKLLLSLLEKNQVTIIGDIQVAQYNPPLSMPLILRNEIIIGIE
jgi:SOUL heme-binding protein